MAQKKFMTPAGYAAAIAGSAMFLGQICGEVNRHFAAPGCLDPQSTMWTGAVIGAILGAQFFYPALKRKARRNG